MVSEVARVGKRGTVVIPAKLRKKLGLEEGDLMIMEATATGLVIRPALAVPVGDWSPERRAGFILNAASDPQDYARAREVVRGMGLDPDRIPHDPPPGAKNEGVS
jgi:AbrB family looped-hinge helix DNA binding protein